MDLLHRELAPISDAAWEVLDAEASRALRHFLAARKLVDMAGPLGGEVSAISIGGVKPISRHPRPDHVNVACRRSLPMLELRRPVELPREELDAIDRGARDPDLSQLVDACRATAAAEDSVVFEGASQVELPGILSGCPHEPIEMADDFERYPNLVARAISRLKDAGIGGPYALALGPDCYAEVIETTENGGYPLLRHLSLILGGPVVWAPTVKGAVVVSQRGGDFELTLGEKTSLGYLHHDDESVTLELRESVTFQALTPEAAIPICPPDLAREWRERLIDQGFPG